MPGLLLEPGRFLVGPAGAYLARVVDRKSVDGSTVVILDGGRPSPAPSGAGRAGASDPAVRDGRDWSRRHGQRDASGTISRDHRRAAVLRAGRARARAR